MKIILIGFACSYKTSAGKLLAQKLNINHIDVDAEIEKRSGKTIPQIFETYGEETFRNMETETLQALAQTDNVVISCGGGSVLSTAFANLTQNATVVWLTVNALSVHERLGTSSRPLFDGLTVSEINGEIVERSAYYSRYAAMQVSTDNLTSNYVAEVIYNSLSKN